MEYSAGIIPFRMYDNEEIEFFVGHPGGQSEEWNNYWAFLKGGVENGESWIETAMREFKEESGLPLDDVSEEDLIPLGTSRQNKHKVVIAYGLYYPDIDCDECFSNLTEDGETPEIDKYRWFTYEQLKDATHKMHLPFYREIIEICENS
jgi:predicted NUDIX family NTP pyrophosphohydrolase